MDGQQVGIRTSAIDEKCQAFETLVIYCSTLGGRFAPYLQQSLEVVLQSLRFVLHDGVREACAMYVSLHFVVRFFWLTDAGRQGSTHVGVMRESEQYDRRGHGDERGSTCGVCDLARNGHFVPRLAFQVCDGLLAGVGGREGGDARRSGECGEAATAGIS